MNQLNKNLICNVLCGSHLYGLNTPSSDIDIKGVFLPTLKDTILQRVPKARNFSTNQDPNRKNTSEDEDIQFFSLHHYIKLLGKGEVVAFDLLHARGDNLLQTSEEWEFLYENRHKFYSKRLNGFIGFVIGQTRKYSNRGARYNSVVEVIKFLEGFPKNMRLEGLWKDLPINTFAEYKEDCLGSPVYSVCERMVHPTVTVEHALKVFMGYKTMYGNRAKQAADNDGYDFKAISHAFRCLDEIEDIVHTGDIIFPLRNRKRILNIKLGIEEASDALFEEMDERVEQLKIDLDKSDLPDTIDFEHWDAWLYNLYVEGGLL